MVCVLVVLGDILQVVGQVGLQSGGAWKEAGHYAEQLPSEGTGGSVAVESTF